MEILKISLKEHLLIKNNLTDNLVLQKTQKMLDIKVVLLQCFTTYLIKKNSGGAVKNFSLDNLDVSLDPRSVYVTGKMIFLFKMVIHRMKFLPRLPLQWYFFSKYPNTK